MSYDPQQKSELSRLTQCVTLTTEAEITKVLALLEDNTVGRIFVHRKRGAEEATSRKMSFFQIPRQSSMRTFHPRTIEANAIENVPPTAIEAIAIDLKTVAAR